MGWIGGGEREREARGTMERDAEAAHKVEEGRWGRGWGGIRAFERWARLTEYRAEKHWLADTLTGGHTDRRTQLSLPSF